MESNVINLELYRMMKLVNCTASMASPLCAYPTVADMTFAHVLSVHSSELLWPGDFAEMFYPNLYTLRSEDDWLYADSSHIADHFRCETQRLCGSNYFVGVNTYFNYDCDRYIADSAFLASMFCDDGDDAVYFDDEEDTLNSEILLTQVYQPPKGR